MARVYIATFLMMLGATVALVLVPVFPEGLTSRIGILQNWVEHRWQTPSSQSNSIGSWVFDIGPTEELRRLARASLGQDE